MSIRDTDVLAAWRFPTRKRFCLARRVSLRWESGRARTAAGRSFSDTNPVKTASHSLRRRPREDHVHGKSRKSSRGPVRGRTLRLFRGRRVSIARGREASPEARPNSYREFVCLPWFMRSILPGSDDLETLLKRSGADSSNASRRYQESHRRKSY